MMNAFIETRLGDLGCHRRLSQSTEHGGNMRDHPFVLNYSQAREVNSAKA